MSRGRLALAGVAASLLFVVATALATIALLRIMPHEAAWLDAGLRELGEHHHDGTLVGYIVHNRVAFSGALLAAAVLYLWLVGGPLRRGEAWAWWAFALSAWPGVLSYFSFAATGYADRLHGLGTAGIALLLTVGLWRTWPALEPPRDLPSIARSAVPAWRAWPARQRLGWMLVALWAAATLGAGVLVIYTGMIPVFVPEDLAYMGVSAEALAELSPRLLPFLAHDRSGFGGGLIASGIASLGIAAFARRPGRRPARRVLALALGIGFATAVLIHPVVGYHSLSHLAPFVLKDGAGLAGLVLVRGAGRPERAG